MVAVGRPRARNGKVIKEIGWYIIITFNEFNAHPRTVAVSTMHTLIDHFPKRRKGKAHLNLIFFFYRAASS